MPRPSFHSIGLGGKADMHQLFAICTRGCSNVERMPWWWSSLDPKKGASGLPNTKLKSGEVNVPLMSPRLAPVRQAFCSHLTCTGKRCMPHICPSYLPVHAGKIWFFCLHSACHNHLNRGQFYFLCTLSQTAVLYIVLAEDKRTSGGRSPLLVLVQLIPRPGLQG
ncbi:hypothetical protein PV04_09973 [Phialophora macrospora]|uniref:Uncharacterized protein n=1 Tax=Phialophora macrospora TaxID=1851006 RepID=A0A0D2CDF1_9EURO|nr:hypothetical protein PV04_09973 [Phialophora macrospora]